MIQIGGVVTHQGTLGFHGSSVVGAGVSVNQSLGKNLDSGTSVSGSVFLTRSSEGRSVYGDSTSTTNFGAGISHRF